MKNPIVVYTGRMARKLLREEIHIIECMKKIMR